jgi:hypothetical protein
MRILKILKMVFGIAALSAWMASWGLYYHYAFTRPSKPDPLEGRIYPEHQIRTVFYLTSHERSLWYFLMAVGICCFFLGAAFYFAEMRAALNARGDHELTN